MKKDTLTLKKAKETPAGGVLVGKREGQTMIYDDATVGGYFVGKLHKEGGIKGINKTTGQPIEVQSSEVIITAPAVADQTKREFEGEMLTNREILSKINVSGGGVSLEQGGDVPSEIYFNGSSYNYGGKTMTDYEIMQSMNDCSCEDEYDYGGFFKDGGYVSYKDKYNLKFNYPKGTSHDLEEISKDTGVSIKGLQQIYNKGIGAYKTNPESVRPNVKSKEQWAMARVYSAVMGGKASKVDSNELKMNYGGGLSKEKSIEDIAEMHNVTISHIKSQLRKGIEVESEHTTDKNMQEKIAKDHLVENPNYYTILDKVALEGGGQLDLVDESKKGDHTSRDLNNYNDLMDVGVDGQVGAETGLFADGGSLKPYDANMEVDSADTMYKDGGATLSAEVFEWDKVPTNYRNISKVKKVPFTNNPLDKGLDSIISPFLGKDDLKPVGMGINFDKNGITATDFHKLITLPYPNEKYEGIYDINRVKKIKADQPILIDGNYPNYEAVIPKSNVIKPYEIDVYKLLQYTKTAMNYANKITRGISFKFGDNDRIGFNGSLLSEVLTASLKLGHEKLYAFITQPNRAMVLSPTKDYEVGSDEILLIMPIMLTSTFGTITGYGTSDPDYNRSLKAYFDFNDSEIHNADGSIAEFKMQYENNLSVDDDYLALLSKITKKYHRLPILSYAKVEDGKMTATDLYISLVVKDVNMPNGIYEIVNKAPNITMQPIEDFPSERVFNKDEYETHRQEKRQTAFEFVTFSEVFEFYLDKLLLSVGKDDLRPVMSGICIKKTAQNEMFLVTTDAHTLCKINITDFCDFDKDDRELEYILPTKYLKDFIKLADGSLHFKCNLTNIFIEADNLEYIARVIDGKYPNYDAVIPRESTKAIVFDHVVMNKCLKSQEMTNLLSKYKGQKDILFDFFNIGDTLNVKVSESKSYNVQSDLIETIELCKIDLNYKEVENNLSLDQSVFLLMPSKDNFKENQYFSFRKEFFDTMLETITDTEVECYFTEPNRAYLFRIDAIDYKKTLPIEKTKQQKLSKKDIEQIVELEDMKEVLESNELQEAIETLEMLMQTAKGKDKKDIKEALEIIKVLNENN
jgi:DNA polymerase III sliding clamp (beta) subunit (PCNA family)